MNLPRRAAPKAEPTAEMTELTAEPWAELRAKRPRRWAGR
jgi:hypothetical protein